MRNQALEPLKSTSPKTSQSGRLLLISKLANRSDRRNKRRRNRKTKITSKTLEYEGVVYKIYSVKPGIFKEIIFKIIEQLKIAREIHKRLLVVRFDLHSHSFDPSNGEISLFRKQIIQWVARNYQTHDIGFVWAREQEKAKSQHYHFSLFIDGDKIKRHKKILQVIREKWEGADPSHHMPFGKNPSYFIDDDDVFADAVYRLSYLAKIRGKGHRLGQVKDYSTSRLKGKSSPSNGL
jgi:hypothetical protein